MRSVGSLFITNTTIADLDALAGLESIGGRLWIRSNGELDDCSCGLFELLSNGGVEGEVVIQWNRPGCNSPEEITEPEPGTCRFSVDGEDAPDAGALALTVGPNPAAGAVAVRFALAPPGAARLAVYDVRGRLVATLLDGDATGETTTMLDVTGWAPGVYVVRLDAPGRAESVSFTVTR